MEIIQGKFFEHVFFLNHVKSTSWDETRNTIESIKDWCNENLNGQWIFIEGWLDRHTTAEPIALSYFSKATHESPVNNVSYPPTEIKIKTRWVIAFEREDDAIAFKLKWNE